MARTKRKINPVIPAAAQNQVKARIYRTGGYVRLSVEDSGKPGADTIETQKAQILSYIEQQPDMTFCGVFCDNGHTGTNFERPAFEQLMDEIRTGLVRRPDRKDTQSGVCPNPHALQAGPKQYSTALEHALRRKFLDRQCYYQDCP
nr:recombinase family protein [uncultured Acetatifactor sp.]